MPASYIINQIPFYPSTVDILRLDLIHPHYGGNKIFKLKGNLRRAKEEGFDKILTFGGPHSNHIYATAAYCAEHGIPCIGVIRGEDHSLKESTTLRFAKARGMHLHYISRQAYRNRNEELCEQLKERFGNFYLIPEGGSNIEGVKGCMEILTTDLEKYEYIFCACGTATTFAGLQAAAAPNQKVIGISVLKGENRLIDDANRWLKQLQKDEIRNYQGGSLLHSTILSDYHLGGYASCTPELVEFKREFENRHAVPLDYIYTAKLFYAVCDLLKKGLLCEGSLLVIHSGGVQANEAFENRYHLTPSR